MIDTTSRPPATVTLEMRDFTSRFSANERETVAHVLNERGFVEVLHLFVNEGNADVFLFTVQQDGPMFAIGKGRGEYFCSLLRDGKVLSKARELMKVFENLPEPIASDSSDE